MIKKKEEIYGHFSKKIKHLDRAELTRETIELVKVAGPSISRIFLFLFIFSTVLLMFSDIWLGFWTRNLFDFEDKSTHLYIYLGLAFLAALSVFVRDVFYRFK